MSVRVNDRHPSDIEYENTFSIFNQYISNKLRNLPKRYRHFLGEPFNNILNEIYEDIIKMTYLYLDGKPTSIERYRLGIGILKKIEIAKCFRTTKAMFKMYDDYYGGYLITRKYFKNNPNAKRNNKVVRL